MRIVFLSGFGSSDWVVLLGAVVVVSEHLKRNILGVPYMKESQAGKDLIKESLEIMLKRTESLRQTKTHQILHYENIHG